MEYKYSSLKNAVTIFVMKNKEENSKIFGVVFVSVVLVFTSVGFVVSIAPPHPLGK
jgi:hypothetical protein